MEQLERIGELERRLANMMRIGTIEHIDTRQAKAQVKLGQIVSHWLKWFTLKAGESKTWWAPSIGEQVMILSPCGELNNGIILPAIYTNDIPINDLSKHYCQYPDGTEIIYDYGDHKLYINSAGKVEIVAAELINLKTDQLSIDASSILIKGDVSVKGNIQVSKGDIAADKISLKAHTHLGDNGGVTSIAR